MSYPQQNEYRTDFEHAFMNAIDNFVVSRSVVVQWPTGEELLFRLDSPTYADENEDGSEDWIGDIVEVIKPGRHGVAGDLISVSSNDPPTMVASPDRSRVWRAGES